MSKDNLMLDLVLKSEWFDKIKSGEKTVEYMEFKPYWSNRIFALYDIDVLQFFYGYRLKRGAKFLVIINAMEHYPAFKCAYIPRIQKSFKYLIRKIPVVIYNFFIIAQIVVNKRGNLKLYAFFRAYQTPQKARYACTVIIVT